MFKSLDIEEHMEVVGSDGKHVGTVDHKEGGDRVILTRDDPKAGGHHHLISIDCVDMWTARFTSISRRKKPWRNGRQSPEFSRPIPQEWQPGSGRAWPFTSSLNARAP